MRLDAGDDAPGHADETGHRPARRSLWVLVLLAAGLAGGMQWPVLGPEVCFGLSLLAIVIGSVARGWVCRVALGAAVVLLGAGWINLRTADIAATRLERLLWPGAELDASAAPDERGPLLALEGLVLDEPRVERAVRGDLRLPWEPGPITRMSMAVFRAGPHDQPGREAPGKLWLTVRGQASAVHAGDLVRVLAHVAPVAPPLNPGETDPRPLARQEGYAGRALVDSPEQFEPAREQVGGWAMLRAAACRYLAALRRLAGASLADPPGAPPADAPTLADQGRATLGALLLGTYDADVRDVGEAFRRLGLLHALAISGFHLTAMSLLALWLVRLTGDRGMLEPAIVAGLVIVYLLIVPAEAPVVRSGLMVLALLAAEAGGRRYDAITIMGWVAVALLLWRPMDLWSMGFQLSFGVTGALLWLGRRTHRQWFGGEVILGGYERAPGLFKRMLQGPIGGTISACVLAWAVATPLIAWHTGTVSTLGWLTSIIVLPIVTASLVVGYVALVVGVILAWAPGAGETAAGALDLIGQALAWTVLRLDELPGIVWMLPQLPLLLVLAATALIVVLLAKGPRVAPHALLGGAAVALWLAWSLAGAGRLPAGTPLRIDALAVGEGPCVLVRSADQAVLLDAATGPGSEPLAASRRVQRAARALGVWHVRTIIVRTADSSRLAMIPYLVEPLGITDAILSPALADRIAESPDGPTARWARRLQSAGVSLHAGAAGERLALRWADLDLIELPGGALAVQASVAGDSLWLAGASDAPPPTPGTTIIESRAPPPVGDGGPLAAVASSRRAGPPANAGVVWPWSDGAAAFRVRADGTFRISTWRSSAPR